MSWRHRALLLSAGEVRQSDCIRLPATTLAATVENRDHRLPRINILRDIPATMRFVSAEPSEDLGDIDLEGIDRVIVGLESGPGARPMAAECMERIRRQCREQRGGRRSRSVLRAPDARSVPRSMPWLLSFRNNALPASPGWDEPELSWLCVVAEG